MALGRKPIEIVREGKHQLLTKAEHWGRIYLNEVAKVQNGFAFSSLNFAKTEGLPLIRIRDINNESTVDRYTGEYNDDFIVRKGDILIGMDGDFKSTIWKGGNALLNQRVCRILPNSKNYEPKFLFLCLQPYLNAINEETSSVTVKHLSSKTIEEIPLPLPPLSEQKQIVSKIEELFSELDKGKEQLEMVKLQLKTYRQAVLKWAFEGKFTNKDVEEGQLPEGWKWVKIIDIAEKTKNALKAGPFGSSLRKEFYAKKGYKIYGQEQVISGNHKFGNYFVSKEKFEELKSNSVKPYDVLISLVGTVGKVLILPEDCQEGVINPRLIKISLNNEIYLPKFFKYYFESSIVKSFYSKKAQGTTMDVLNLNIIKSIPFPICSIREQILIINEIETRLSVCDKIEETIENCLRQSESLRQSILKQAFEGKLIKPNANYG